MIRRFVHLIVHDVKGKAGAGYYLRNIDTKPLFAAGIPGGSTTIATSRLPRPAAFFESTNRDRDNHTEFFLLLGGSKIVCVNMNRHTVLYDTVTSGITAGPDLRHCKSMRPPWAAAQGKLYIASTFPDNHGCFEALRFDDELEDWQWDLLPPPPFFDDPYGSDTAIRCHAAGEDEEGNILWISTSGKGTYTFDAATTAWWKEGDWMLPFEDRAQYIPELGLYLGFSKRSSKLCSAKLVAGAMAASKAPVHRHVWDDTDGFEAEQRRWHLARSYLIRLGDGRFCVTRFYDTRRDWDDWCIPQSHVAVMSALEATVDPSTGDVEMIRGASRCYKFSPGTVDGWAL